MDYLSTEHWKQSKSWPVLFDSNLTSIIPSYAHGLLCNLLILITRPFQRIKHKIEMIWLDEYHEKGRMKTCVISVNWPFKLRGFFSLNKYPGCLWKLYIMFAWQCAGCPSRLLQSQWSLLLHLCDRRHIEVNQMFWGWPLLTWPSPASLTTSFKSASAPQSQYWPKVPKNRPALLFTMQEEHRTMRKGQCQPGQTQALCRSWS